VFLYYSFLTLLIDKSDTGNNLIKNKLTFWERSYDTNMSKIVGKIEIQNANQELEVVYFPLPAIVKVFWSAKQVSDYRNETIYEINRDNPEEKVLDF